MIVLACSVRVPGVNNRAQLGDFLRRRREDLTPAQVGLPAGARRRTPGLRRHEVATLANMSATYYERLEQGRGPRPSASVVAGLAQALRLTADERDHLYTLAGQAQPTAVQGRDVVDPDPALQYVLQAVGDTTPAFITDDLGTVVAQNLLNVEVFGLFTGLAGREANIIWRWFTSPAWRELLGPPDQHEDTGLSYVADLRATLARRGNDPEATGLINDLRAASAEFADMWERHVVSALHCATKVVHERRVGRLDLDCSVLTSPLSQQRLLLMQPVPGTPTKERLDALSSTLSTHKQSVAGGSTPA
jgi:transcriptional regulator with XRE-family HTH domain